MGVHTWFYEKVDLHTLDLDEMKNSIIKMEVNTISYLRELIKSEPWDKQSHLKEIKRIENILKNIRNNKLNRKKKLIKLYITNKTKFFIIKNELYKTVEYHDIFRTSKEIDEDILDDTVLTNLDNTLQFISDFKCFGQTYFCDKQNKIVTDDIDLERLKEFWVKYPEGVIDFG